MVRHETRSGAVRCGEKSQSAAHLFPRQLGVFVVEARLDDVGALDEAGTERVQARLPHLQCFLARDVLGVLPGAGQRRAHTQERQKGACQGRGAGGAGAGEGAGKGRPHLDDAQVRAQIGAR